MSRYPVATFCAGIGVGMLLAQLFRGSVSGDYVARRMSEHRG